MNRSPGRFPPVTTTIGCDPVLVQLDGVVETSRRAPATGVPSYWAAPSTMMASAGSWWAWLLAFQTWRNVITDVQRERRRARGARPAARCATSSAQHHVGEAAQRRPEPGQGRVAAEDLERLEQRRPHRAAGDRDPDGRLRLAELESLGLADGEQRGVERLGVPIDGGELGDRSRRASVAATSVP